MDREEALKLLRAGPDGVAEWNRRREAGEHTPRLSDAGLSGARLMGALFSGANLSGANLSRANLSEANFGQANFRGADLNEANLSWAFLGGANFGAANLMKANFSDANLDRANLSGANLGGAFLGGARLRRTLLSAAILAEAACDETSFADVDLSEVKGLDSVEHQGPSTIGIDTLFRSRGKIPEAFLRGCGVPESVIVQRYALIGAMDPIQFYSCFISYSSQNRPFAERLNADLQARGVRCWFDEKDLKTGDKIRDRITEAIRVHDKLMLVLTQQSIASDWVEGEVEAALERERMEKKTVLFPIRLDEAVIESQKGWAAHIRQTRRISDFRGWENHGQYQVAFARLLKDLEAAIPPSPAA
jgi:hypothetical protein